ncbi:BMC domain-containing protein [Brachyspira hampsonii]|uniref:BMC domain-containing protein n=1 Tax=Brachyspira hampsonii TaxID=1287055 RepID=A0A1E5NAB3_9SPIR|nr:BMC domain-containing protein [Brachyspira hampsonii]OEJ13085.1 BMC domain-containing protein [Brachyspira hampsonii]
MEYALGMIETHGHTAAIEALDAANKSSNIILPSMMHVGSGRIAVSFFGDVSAVKVAVDAGVAAAEKVGKVLGSNVIARLDKQVLNTLFSYASSDNNTVEDGNKEIKENEEKNTEENKQLESNTEIINENADISSSNANAENASFFDEDINKKTDSETASNESVSKKKTRKKKKNDNQ